MQEEETERRQETETETRQRKSERKKGRDRRDEGKRGRIDSTLNTSVWHGIKQKPFILVY